MPGPESRWSALQGHALTLDGVTLGIDARVHALESHTVVFQYVLRAAMDRVRIAPLRPPERADGLWKHTCFEAFIRARGAKGYLELNFSPSRQWAIYRFDGYRDGMASLDLDSPPQICVRSFAERLEIEAAVRLQELAALRGARHLQVALSAIVEEDNDTLSYWALQHGPGRPDFHDPDSFLLELAL